jgi:hypothetical protein
MGSTLSCLRVKRRLPLDHTNQTGQAGSGEAVDGPTPPDQADPAQIADNGQHGLGGESSLAQEKSAPVGSDGSFGTI